MFVVIGADLVPTESNEKDFMNGDLSGVLDDQTLTVLADADFRIFNLETPLYDGNTPIKKAGPNLSAKCGCVNGIKALNVDLCTLANNHIMDHGTAGLNSTIETLKNAKIDYVGVGKNVSEASKPYFFNFAEKKIGVFACAEHEFSVAAENTPGANPADLIEIFDHIQQLKSECDYIIVLYHGGKEYYRYPSPDLQKVCRKLVDKGANLVVTQHSHCVGCKEEYSGATIVYGQGNFLFDKKHDEFWDEGLLVTVNENLQVGFVPLRECNMQKFYERSVAIRSAEFIKQEYSKFAKKMYEQQTSPFRKRETFIFKVFNKLFRNKLRNKATYNVPEDKIYTRINFIECEAHRELLLEGLKGLVNANNEEPKGFRGEKE